MQVAGRGAAVTQRGSRIGILRDGREVFRSAGRFRAAGVFALAGRRSVAFSYDDYRRGDGETTTLYIAPLGGHERKVAAGERPLGWSRGRLLIWRYRAGLISIYLRSADGRLIGRVGGGLREIRFRARERSLLALSRRGVLERYDRRWHRLADLRALGFGRHASFEPLAGNLIGILEGGRVAVLRRDGRLFASARFPEQRTVSVAGESGLVADATGAAVAFAVTIGDSGGGGGPGSETLYLLRSGDRRASRLYGGRLDFAICERWATLAWHGSWLLYATPEGRTLLLDSRSPRRRIDLSTFVQRLAPIDPDGKIDAAITLATRAVTGRT